MMDEIPNGTYVVFQGFRERQSLSGASIPLSLTMRDKSQTMRDKRLTATQGLAIFSLNRIFCV